MSEINEIRAENERLKALLKEAAEWCQQYADDVEDYEDQDDLANLKRFTMRLHAATSTPEAPTNAGDVTHTLTVVMHGGNVRCVYLNDYRIVGPKPYVTESLTPCSFTFTGEELSAALRQT